MTVYDGVPESRPSGRSSGFEDRDGLQDSLLYDERSEFMRKDSVMTKRAKGCIRIIACAFLLAGMGLLGANQARAAITPAGQVLPAYDASDPWILRRRSLCGK